MAAAAPTVSSDSGVENDLEAKVMSSPVVKHSNYVPTQLERHFEFIGFNSDGHMILGCSNLVGRYWVGSLWYYRDPDEAPSVEKALTGIDFDNGIVDGVFIGDDAKNIIVAGDNGGVEHVKLSFEDGGEDAAAAFYFLERLTAVQEHDDIVSGLGLTADTSKIVTSSFDRSVVVLDAKTFKLESRLDDAHDDLVTHVGCNRVDPNVIATAGNDGHVATWDIRSMASTKSSLADISEDTRSWPTCVEWAPANANLLFAGNQTGELSLYDVRKPKSSVGRVDCVAGKQVSRVRFRTGQPGRTVFAVCCEAYPVKVFELGDDLSAINEKYVDERHDDFVRDVAWHPKCAGKFYSCGWDHKVISHTLH